MTETRTSDLADAGWTHPIPADVVTDVAENVAFAEIVEREGYYD